MHTRYNTTAIPYSNEERFIGPLIPFLGGAAIGYIAGRPQYTYPTYYPVYYPYYMPYYYNNIPQQSTYYPGN